MHSRVILRVTGILLMLFSTTMLLPVLVGLIYGEQQIYTFLIALAVIAFSGLLLWAPTRGARELRSQDGFVITALFYFALGLFGALPLYLSGVTGGSFTDAVFESVSGLTTTGGTVITGLDTLPHSINFYRHQLQWLGGMGLIVLAVAVLPMLGIGGMQLYRAESPGPTKDKLTPRIADTAKSLWLIYGSLTAVFAVSYWLAGMTPFDAICHAFTTVATGGFSTHDRSFAYFDSSLIEGLAIVFMIIGGINFGLHYLALSRRTLGMHWRDPELRCFLLILVSACTVVATTLALHHPADLTWQQAAVMAVFQVVSFATTTGYTTADISIWPGYTALIMLLVGLVGACAGSTSGGIKSVRVLLLTLQGVREIRRLVHPTGVFTIKLGRALVPDRVIEAVWAFFTAYVILYLIFWIALLALGLDMTEAFSAVGANLSNVGPALEDVAANYKSIVDPAKWILILAMILGRLEIFTLLVLFTPTFWRR